MIRTRFAPSPTGRLHLGNVRTAVFNWLFARHHGGAFVLRIEDTDVGRTVEGSEGSILEDLRWLGLEWDEGPGVGGPFGPYRQSERMEGYRRAADELVEAGRAYPCYCTEAELQAEADAHPGEVVRYSGRCRALTDEERMAFDAEGRAYTIRFAVPEVDRVEIEDEIRGSISFPGNDMTDFILMRQDGRPTYNFAVVVDDRAMDISHVIRGAGHLSNTPRQALLFDALDAERPAFAHLPTVLSPDGGRLSKREGSAAVAALREEGYPPDGVVNYLSLLGWSSEDEREVLSREELVERISLDRVGASDTTYDPEKLAWMSGQHLAAMDREALAAEVAGRLDRERIPLAGDGLRAAVEVLRSRMNTFADFERYAAEFLFPPEAALERGRREFADDPAARRVIEAVAADLHKLASWKADALGASVRATGKEIGVRGAALFHPVRTALSGSESGPDLGGVMAAIGREEVERRLEAALV